MSYEGADLSQMAKDGTRVPEDAAKPNIIPSKAGFHNLQPTAGGLGAAMLSEAADNPVSDEKRMGKHGPGVGEVITGTGDSMPSMTSTKHTGTGGKNRQ